METARCTNRNAEESWVAIMEKVTKRVLEKRQSIWEKEPGEIREALKKSRGTFGQSFFPALYATEGSRNMHLAFLTFRTALLNPECDFRTMKLIVENFMTSAVPVTFLWSGMPETGEFLQDVAKEIGPIETREELRMLFEELILYVGRLNYWLDAAMPWYPLLETYEKMK